ncbi:hypothetical protein [Haliangium sp.]|uniref:hypothetical protein n=1 Tax=Haliangium sp. TaxID=2663208 RepID=UPI003D112527
MVKYTWGGYRPGSGRRPKGEVSGVSHHTREEVSARHPVRVILRTKPELGNLRKKGVHEVIRAALVEGCDTGSFRICHYALQRHGLLLVVEAKDRTALSRGMQGINVRMAKSLNRLWERNGSVFSDRYDTHSLKNGRAVRETLCYVLNNARLNERPRKGSADSYSSAAYFDGWKNPPTSLRPGRGAPPVAKPRTALLKSGWRKYGLLDIDEVPDELDEKRLRLAEKKT